MTKITKALILGSFAAILGIFSLFIPWGQALEEDVGLGQLFRSRGERVVPERVVAISMDKVSADALGLANDPSKWPRQLHAQLVDGLRQAGAAVIAFDVLFKEAKDPVQDQRLATAFKNAGNVVLFAFMTKDLVKLPSASGVSEVLVERRIPPLPLFAKSAVAVAPFPLPKVPVKVSHYWKFSPDAGDVATLPLVAFQLMALPHYPLFYDWLRSVAPRVADRLPASQALILKEGLIPFMHRLRAILVKRPTLATDFLQYARTADWAAETKQILTSIIRAFIGPRIEYLNYYGPPRSIPIVSYSSAIQHFTQASVPSAHSGGKSIPENFFRDKIVLVGFAESLQWEQRDAFYSVYSLATGLDISGVEIAATAIANLFDGTALHAPAPWMVALVIVCWGLWLGVVTRLISSVWATVVTLLSCIGYFTLASVVFSQQNIWLPLVVPLLIQAPLILFLGVLWMYVDINRERSKLRQAFGYYLPDAEVDRLAKNVANLASTRRMVYGVCLSTDAARYTTLSERLDPESLGSLMNEYYEVLFTPVRTYGGIVSDVVGDAMLAIWVGTDNDQDLKRKACLAALDIMALVYAFNQNKGDRALPTRIGLHCGSMLMGNVGAVDHFEYRAVGDIVNSSTRIEGMNKYLGTRLLASGEVVEDLQDIVTCNLGDFILAGKTKPVQLHELVGIRASCDSQQLAASQAFEEALQAFQQKDWQKARTLWSECIEKFGNKKKFSFYQNLCKNYQDNPPKQDWRGVVDMVDK